MGCDSLEETVEVTELKYVEGATKSKKSEAQLLPKKKTWNFWPIVDGCGVHSGEQNGYSLLSYDYLKDGCRRALNSAD